MSGRARAAAVAILAGLAAVVALSRLHVYDEPLDCDIATYAVIAHEMLEGRELYSDLWDHKPPGVHVVYAAAELLVGYGRASIYLIGAGAAILTLAGAFLAGSARGASARPLAAGLWAVAAWAAIQCDLRLQADLPNVEALLNASLVWAFAGLVRAEARLGMARAIGIGALFAAASLFKQNAVAPAALLAAGHVAWPPGGREGRRDALREAVAMGLVGVLAWAGVIGYFAARGRFADFLDANFAYNAFYARNTGASLLRFDALLAPAALALAPLAPVALARLALADGGELAPGRARPIALLAALAAGTYISVALPGKFFAHYYQLWMVPVVVGFGWGIAALEGRARSLGHAVGAAALAGVLAIEVPTFAVPAAAWRTAKSGDAYADIPAAAAAVERLLAPGETFYGTGFEVPLYFETRRPPPAGVVYFMPLITGPLTERLNARVIAALERARPELLHVPANVLGERRWRSRAFAWCLERYDPLPDGYHGRLYALFALRGGALERRIRAGEAPPPARER